MEMRCFCAQAQEQVTKSEIYLAISSLYLINDALELTTPWYILPPNKNYWTDLNSVILSQQCMLQI